jgi:CRISPR-associated protein Cas8b1/Cst1 subtype I-B
MDKQKTSNPDIIIGGELVKNVSHDAIIEISINPQCVICGERNKESNVSFSKEIARVEFSESLLSFYVGITSDYLLCDTCRIKILTAYLINYNSKPNKEEV